MTAKETRYTISALARKTGLSVHTLRYYEKEGIIRHVERTQSGRRVYGEDSVACLIGALCLKQARVTLAQIKEFFDATVQGEESLPLRLAMLNQAHANLVDMQESVARSLKLVDFFIQGTKEAIKASEDGRNPDEAFPLITRAGIAQLPTIMMEDGKLAPDMPSLIASLDK
jgi:DNA-binding transcriptional MerR regulator